MYMYAATEEGERLTNFKLSVWLMLQPMLVQATHGLKCSLQQ